MQLNWIALAVPVFLGFIALEYYVSNRRQQKTFQFAESVANLNVGIAERVTDMLTTGIFYLFFDHLPTLCAFLPSAEPMDLGFSFCCHRLCLVLVSPVSASNQPVLGGSYCTSPE